MLEFLLATLVNSIPLLVTVAVVVGGLLVLNLALRRRWQDQPDAQFRFQLTMLALSFAGLLAILIALPINDQMRGQLLSLIGILLTAAIALASTTFIGNIMAGIMLKVVGSARPGDFITVADLTGRITEMALLHTEIQTEFRDLVTVPNLYLVTQPVQVVRASGTVLAAEVSLGYDVQRRDVTAVLKAAARKAGLKEPFVHVRDLGDFAITYRVAGMLEDVHSLISARSELRCYMLDALHEAGVEIVSPNFMNSRALGADVRFIPHPASRAQSEPETSAEQLAFDKAQDAAEIESIRSAIVAIDEQLTALSEVQDDVTVRDAEALEAEKLVLLENLRQAEERSREAEESESRKNSLSGP